MAFDIVLGVVVETVFFVQNYFFKKKNYIALMVRKFSNSKYKILKSAFGKKHLKLTMADGRSFFSNSVLLLYGDSVGGYIKHFFFPIGNYFMESL